MKQFLLLTTFVITIITSAQDIKSPSEFLGYELGTQFTRHHKVVDYYEYLSNIAPDRVQLQEYGITNERRPLLLAFISSAANMGNLENIRTEHLKSRTGESNAT
ncbi:MAG: zinc carboxypeptidase, partial [Maribacter sp.]|nr:zinc carboxypeptidase [Maribacter sp.]